MNACVISGASSGMGRDFALQLDKMYQFDCIYLIARRVELLKDLEKTLRSKVKILSLDLKVDLEAFREVLINDKPNIKYLVNAAGFGKFGTYKEVNLDQSFDMIDVNVKALVGMCMICLDYMDKGSKIINLGSASSFFPLKNFNIYASTKAFVVHYSNALHDELKPRKISCTVVCPGYVKTEFFDVALKENHNLGPKKFKPMLDSKKVVKKAIKASNKNKKFSVYNYFTKIHRFAARFFPRFIVLSLWSSMQKKEVKNDI